MDDKKLNIYNIVIAIGGITGLLAVVGSLIIESYLLTIELWGVYKFPVGFYKNALIQIVIEGVQLYLKNPWWILIPCVVLYLWHRYLCDHFINEKYDKRYIIGGFVSLLLVYLINLIIILFKDLLLQIDKEIGYYSKFIAFGILIPTFLTVVMYLLLNYKKPFRDQYQIIILFITLLIIIPITYGRWIFDIDVYLVEDLSPCKEFKSDLLDIKSFKGDTTVDFKDHGFKSYYLLGHASDREVFVISKGFEKHIVLIHKNCLKGLRLSEDTHKLKVLLAKGKKEIEARTSKKETKKTITESHAKIWMQTPPEFKTKEKPVLYNKQNSKTLDEEDLQKWLNQK